MRAPWPARQNAARNKKPAIPVGMTDKEKRKTEEKRVGGVCA
jgi:hypothetical protein